MKKEVFEFAKRVFSKYKGIITSDENGVCITADNNFGEKIVKTECSVSLLNSIEWPYSIYAEEKTFSIKGGIGRPCKDFNEVKENLENTLQAFKFELNEQMSLFEF